jgi:hypothetical protein
LLASLTAVSGDPIVFDRVLGYEHLVAGRGQFVEIALRQSTATVARGDAVFLVWVRKLLCGK